MNLPRREIVYWIALLVVLGALALNLPACQSRIARTAIYKAYLPIVMSVWNPDPRFAVQWTPNCCQNIEEMLHLSQHQGADCCALIPWNDVQLMRSDNIIWGGLNECSYNHITEQMKTPQACRDWIDSNREMIWIVGNEPDYTDPQTPEQYAKMYLVFEDFVGSERNFIVTAWADDSPEGWDIHQAQFISAYQLLRGRLPSPLAWSYHYYHSSGRTMQFAKDRLLGFLNKIPPGSILWLTEFGWYGGDIAGNTYENVVPFMQKYTAYLKTQTRVKRWMWWQWDYGLGSMLIEIDGTITPSGICYSKLANGGDC